MLRFEGYPDAHWMKLLALAHHDLLKQLEGFRANLSVAQFRKGSRTKYPVLTAEALEEMLSGLTIEISETMRTCAGRAWPHFKKIALNYRLLADNPDQLLPTYRHELAHIIAGQLYGGHIGHAREWKALALALGDDAGRCHSMNTAAYAAKRQKFDWTCGCRDFKLGAVRNRRAQAGIAVKGRSGYRCQTCQKQLIPKG